MVLILVLTLGVIAIAATAALALRTFSQHRHDIVPEAEWIQTFCPKRYRPMLTMLSEDDYDWLASQKLDKSLIRNLRAQRRDVFQTYLNNLVRDFDLLYSSARLLLLSSTSDQPELASRLIRVKAEFQRTVFVVRFHLLLHRSGVLSVDVRRLVAGIEAVHQDLHALLPTSQSRAAA